MNESKSRAETMLIMSTKATTEYLECYGEESTEQLIDRATLHALQSIAASLIVLTTSEKVGTIDRRPAVLSNRTEPQDKPLPSPSTPSAAMTHGNPLLTDAQGEENS